MSDGSNLVAVDAERSVLGGLLLHPIETWGALNKHQVDASGFAVPSHRMVYAEIAGMAEGQLLQVNMINVLEGLVAKGKVSRDEARKLLNECADALVTIAHMEYHVQILREKMLARRVIKEAEQARLDASAGEGIERLMSELPERFAALVDNVETEVSNREVMVVARDQWAEAKRMREAGENPTPGLPTPWYELTKLMCGLEVGTTILAGRPSHGKTTMEDQIAVYLAQQGIPVGRVTLDSTRDELLQRALCRAGGVSLPKLKFGFAGHAQLAQVDESIELLADLPMWITDEYTDVRSICAWARRMKMKHDIQLLTIDYLQLMEASEISGGGFNQNLVISLISRRIKALAIELDIPVLLLSQLSRALEAENRRPRLSDLRDSGSIEQDASKVVFVYRDDKLAKQMDKDKPGWTKELRPTWVEVAKHKNGSLGLLPMWMRPHYFLLEPSVAGDFDTDLEMKHVQ